MKSAFVFPVSSCALLGVVMVLHGAVWAQPVAPVTRETAEEAAADAMEAYIYGYPLVTMEMTRRVMTNVAAPTGKLAPMGRFAHLRSYPSPTDKEVTAPTPTRCIPSPGLTWPRSLMCSVCQTRRADIT